jgi:ABC-2 type transport system permease protein
MLALWFKAIREVRWQLSGSILIVLAFHWIRVWITSLFPIKQFQRLLAFIPDTFLPLLPVPKEDLATVAGRIAIAYDDPLPVMVLLAWAIGRGSDSVSGELGRGTLEMVLAQPVRRITVIGTQAAVTILGAAIICYAAWLGTYMGVHNVTLEEPVSAKVFVPAAINAFSMTVFLAGLATLLSSFDRFRARTIGIMAGFFAVELLLKVVGLVGEDLHWLLNCTFLTAFEPQRLVANPEWAWSLTVPLKDGDWAWGGLSYQAIMLGIGLICYALGMTHFCRRDLPAPL